MSLQVTKHHTAAASKHLHLNVLNFSLKLTSRNTHTVTQVNQIIKVKMFPTYLSPFLLHIGGISTFKCAKNEENVMCKKTSEISSNDSSLVVVSVKRGRGKM